MAFAHPIPGFPLPPEPRLPVPPRGYQLGVRPYLEAKRQAVAEHRSQVSALIEDDPGGFRLPPEALALAFSRRNCSLRRACDEPSGPLAVPDYFDALYADDPDPWRFASSDYERDKYAATLAGLSRALYKHAFEVGCSIGVLTQALASRCGRLLAVDAAEALLIAARERCARLPQVSSRRMQLPEDWPADPSFDLILLSEVVYYLYAVDIARLAARVGASLAPKSSSCTGRARRTMRSRATRRPSASWQGRILRKAGAEVED